ncbi:DUF5682 family protein [Nocardiopsis sp. HUAS JQ3]|uniref:DUF5682 family protein n=1 Tax=Nocardiopsis sp. HUAS JQ3 TaxID=3061629 RepID=UPI0023A97E87|nr:DUF5682 family protein [Nocardiopsis sp. HUAS JQ3]WDZ90714.1 DUF5682 family protein [Nocardiopsis sp. HUAS JQ3]
MGRPRLDTSGLHVLGVRHHGPGSARAVRAALEEIKPDAVLIEGPPEADALTSLVGELEPPVALLAYLADTPKGDEPRAGEGWAFWPFASFSPEWEALRYAVENDVRVRFCDLPAANTLAERVAEAEERRRAAEEGARAEEDSGEPGSDGVPGNTDVPEAGGNTGTGSGDEDPGTGGNTTAPEDTGTAGAGAAAAARETDGTGASEAADGTDGGEVGEPERIRLDPLGVLAEAAGYDDAERWWDDVIEQRRDGEPSPFPAIADAMAAVRAESGPETERDARREAYMRQTLRATLKEGHERIAVVCGAWHAPALRDLADYPIKEDTALLKGLPKAKVTATWVPWTHGRLAASSGYGAGVAAPGWYHHLFTAPDLPVHRWLTDAARMLREEGLAVSSSHVIEGVRLAEGLAVLRGRPLAGLDEVAEALTAVLCEGEPTRAALVHRRMSVGERMGSVPPSTPMVPLQRDIIAIRKRLRLKAEPFDSDLDLDLRKDSQRERSVLLHRLRLLGVEWGVPRTPDGGQKGTFRESWRLRWDPDMDVALIEASRWGTTVASAATARVADLAEDAALPALTSLTEQCLFADLGEALPRVLSLLTDRAATDSDVTHLMEALPPLARSARYGDVRGTDSAYLSTVAEQILRRVCVGLAPAVHGLDDDAAERFVRHIDATQGAATLLGGEGARAWTAALAALAVRDTLPGRIAGRVNRILSDSGLVDADELRRRLGLAMSPGAEPASAAAWLEGFLQGSGLILVHDDRLLGLIDTWLLSLPEERFTAVLPLLRRTFGAFNGPERQEIGSAALRLGTAPAADRTAPARVDVDARRAAPALATALAILTDGKVRT